MGAGVNWDKIDNSHQDAYIFPASGYYYFIADFFSRVE